MVQHDLARAQVRDRSRVAAAEAREQGIGGQTSGVLARVDPGAEGAVLFEFRAAQATALTGRRAVRLARTLKAIADPARLRLLSLVAAHEGAEACVCDLVAPLGCPSRRCRTT